MLFVVVVVGCFFVGTKQNRIIAGERLAYFRPTHTHRIEKESTKKRNEEKQQKTKQNKKCNNTKKESKTCVCVCVCECFLLLTGWMDR